MDKGFHSRAYHRYFEDYEEIVVTGKNGKGKKIKRVYTGAYYVPQVTYRKYICLKIGFVFLFILETVLFFAAAAVPVEGNKQWFVVLPIAASFLAMLNLFRYLLHYITAKQWMTAGEYKEGPLSVQKTARITAVCLLLTAAANIVFIVIYPEKRQEEDILAVLLFVLSAAVGFLMHWTEKHIRYGREDSDSLRLLTNEKEKNKK